MKNGIQISTSIFLGSIQTIIIVWIAFFSRFYDGAEYIYAWLITCVCIWIICLAIVDAKFWDDNL